MITRPKYQTRHIMLVGSMQKDTAKVLIDNAPMDPTKPIEVVIREYAKPRKPDQNSLMWVGPLADIADQAWFKGKQYSAEVWHETFKRLYLPEEHIEGITKEGYRKWAIDPYDNMILVGSTKDLTVKGFSDYLEQVYADGANMGVRFNTQRAA